MKKMIVGMSTSGMGYLDKPDNVAILSTGVRLDGVNYVEHKDIDTAYLYKQLSRNPSLPFNSLPPHEGDILEFFYDLVKEGVNEILVITVSSKLSQTYQKIREIQTIFGERLKIDLFDSRTIGHGEALLIYEASRMLEMGKNFFDIMLYLKRMREKMRIYVIIDDLKTLIRNKRISAPAGFFATLLDIKPIIYVSDAGEFVPHEKIRHFERSLYRMVESVVQGTAGKKGTFYVAVCKENPYMSVLDTTLKDFGLKNVVKVPVSTAIAINGGINTIGMMFFEE